MSSELPDAQLDIDLLIEEVKVRECLWARNHLRYGDVNYKRNEWENITHKLFVNVWAEYDEHEKAEKVQLVQRRWKNLRACFTREVKRERDPNWIYGVAYKRRKYVYYNALSFLRPECEGTDEDARNDIDLPLKTDSDNTTITLNTNIEEIPIPEPLPVPKSEAKTNIYIPRKTKSALNSDNNKTYKNSDNNRALTNSDNTNPSNSDDSATTSTKNGNDDSTNFALSLVPMLNMIPIDERIEAQIEILSVLQPFLKKSRDVGKKETGDKRRRKSSSHVYGKKRMEHTVSIEIKSDDEDESKGEQAS